MSRILIFVILVTSLFSCQKTRYKAKLIQIYQLENERNNHPIDIHELEILNYKSVDNNFVNTISINELQEIIELKKYQLDLIIKQDSMIKLNIERYESLLKNKESLKVDKYKKGLNSTKNDLANLQKEREFIEREIDGIQSKINLIEQRIDSITLRKFTLVTYKLIASNDSIDIKDTLSIFLNKDNYTFLKNELISDYKGG